MKSRIHMIRHGITEGNKKKWYYGKADLPLIQEGIDELAALREEGIYPEIDDDTLIFTSGLLRTRQTLELIYGKTESHVIEKLQEWDCGEFECKTYDELKDIPKYKEYFEHYSDDIPVPGGERRIEFYERTGKGFEELLVRHETQMIKLRNRPKEAVSLAVIHGAVICSVMSRYFGNGVDAEFWKWMVKPGRGYTVFMEDGKLIGYEKI